MVGGTGGEKRAGERKGEGASTGQRGPSKRVITVCPTVMTFFLQFQFLIPMNRKNNFITTHCYSSLAESSLPPLQHKHTEEADEEQDDDAPENAESNPHTDRD